MYAIRSYYETAAAASTRDQGAPAPVPETKPDSGQVVQAAGSIDPAQLESIVEKAVTKALNKKITPLTKMMADLEQKGPSMNDVITSYSIHYTKLYEYNKG